MRAGLESCSVGMKEEEPKRLLLYCSKSLSPAYFPFFSVGDAAGVGEAGVAAGLASGVAAGLAVVSGVAAGLASVAVGLSMAGVTAGEA